MMQSRQFAAKTLRTVPWTTPMKECSTGRIYHPEQNVLNTSKNTSKLKVGIYTARSIKGQTSKGPERCNLMEWIPALIAAWFASPGMAVPKRNAAHVLDEVKMRALISLISLGGLLRLMFA